MPERVRLWDRVIQQLLELDLATPAETNERHITDCDTASVVLDSPSGT
jgi:hypothetical protein